MERKIIDFWCRRCRQDWHILGVRRWLSSLFPDGWHARCPECNTGMVRLIGEPQSDPYFRLSRKVVLERRKLVDDLVQMGDPRFDFLYPQHKREREEKARQAEKDKFLSR